MKIDQRDANMLSLLRYALYMTDEAPALTAEEWQQVFDDGSRHSLVALLYQGVSRMPQAQHVVPLPLLLHWAGDASNIAQLNRAMNAEAARLTSVFEAEGHDTVILKGQANALLYPHPESRQPGDIDIYVSGGKEQVMATLRRLGMVGDSADECYHHITLACNAQGIEVEVHFRPSSRHSHPEYNERMQQYLTDELGRGRTMTSAGFRVPTMRFALVMQLAHIRHHLLIRGIGLRQLIDYWMLMRHSTYDDRHAVAGQLKALGLWPMARALMWLIGYLFGERYRLLPVKPSPTKGRWLLRRVLRTGNFGYHDRHHQDVLWREVLRVRAQLLPMLWFEPEFAGRLIVRECRYWWNIVRKTPDRIRLRTLSLRDHPETWG